MAKLTFHGHATCSLETDDGGIVQLPGGEAHTSLPAGYLINLNSGQRFHHTGDPGLITF